MSLREEIFEIVTKISRRLKTEEDWMATDEILSIFEKRIDKAKEQNLCPDLMMYKGYNLACDWIKEMLK